MRADRLRWNPFQRPPARRLFVSIWVSSTVARPSVGQTLDDRQRRQGKRDDLPTVLNIVDTWHARIGRLGMTDVASFNPHKEEDEGYLAAKVGQSRSRNPYPRGTIRHENWRLGWQIKAEVIRREFDEGYLAAEAEAGQTLSQNPYPRGTIRYEEWRLGWQIKTNEAQRAIRLEQEDITVRTSDHDNGSSRKLSGS